MNQNTRHTYKKSDDIRDAVTLCGCATTKRDWQEPNRECAIHCRPNTLTGKNDMANNIWKIDMLPSIRALRFSTWFKVRSCETATPVLEGGNKMTWRGNKPAKILRCLRRNELRIVKELSSIALRRVLWLFAGIIIGNLTGCTATPPQSQGVTQMFTHDALQGGKGGILILVDVSIQKDLVRRSSDYFVLDSAEAEARVALDALHKYIQDSDVPVRAEFISVCGARLSTNNSPIRVADKVGAPVREVRQPVVVYPRIKDNPAYLKALGVICTYAFEHAAVPDIANAPSRPNMPASVSLEDFRRAAGVIGDRTHAARVLFVGILGNSNSERNKSDQGITVRAGSGGSAFARSGLGTGYYLIFTRGHQVEGLVMEGALIDLTSGKVTWSNAVQVQGDPMRPQLLVNSGALDLLLRKIMIEPSTAPAVGASSPKNTHQVLSP